MFLKLIKISHIQIAYYGAKQKCQHFHLEINGGGGDAVKGKRS